MSENYISYKNGNEIAYETKKTEEKMVYPLKEVKSKLILKKIISCIQREKLMKIIFRNKKLQNKLNLSINDYKKLCTVEIEMEIINRKIKEDAYFIHYLNEEISSFYHIYFDDNKEEMKRNYLTPEDKITKIKISIDSGIESLKNLFYNCAIIKRIKFNKFNIKDIIDFSYMFYNCKFIENIDVSKVKTENVKKL